MANKIMKEATQANLDAIRKELEEVLVPKYNNIAQGDGTMAELTEVTDLIEESVNEYTALSKTKCFNELSKKKNPMLEGVKKLDFDTVQAKKGTVEGTKLPKMEIVDVVKPIDPAELHKAISKGRGVTPEWVYMMEKLNMLFTARVVQKLKGIDTKIAYDQVNDSYYMKDLSSKVEFIQNHEGDDVDMSPLSDASLIASMEQTLETLIGQKVKLNERDLAYLDIIYAKKGKKALKVSCANHKNFRRYMTEICHKTVLGKSYDADWKIKK